MHLTKPTLLLLALTISAGYVAATPHPGLLEGLWNDLGKTGQTIVSGIVEAGKAGGNIASGLVEAGIDGTAIAGNLAGNLASGFVEAGTGGAAIAGNLAGNLASGLVQAGTGGAAIVGNLAGNLASGLVQAGTGGAAIAGNLAGNLASGLVGAGIDGAAIAGNLASGLVGAGIDGAAIAGNLAGNLASGLVEVGKNGTAIAGNLVGSLANSTINFIDQTAQFADQIAGALHAAVSQSLLNFREALRANIAALNDAAARVVSRVKRQALQDALAGLQGINASVSDLEIALQNITDQLELRKAQYGAEIQLKWNNWAAAQLDSVDEQTNGEGFAEAQEILDELENRYSGYLQSCLEELQVRLATYEQEVYTAVARFQNVTNDLASQINLCVQVRTGPISCRVAIKKTLIALQTAPQDLLSLKLKGLRLLAINLDGAGCVGQTLADYALERPSVELQLAEIIQRYQEQSTTSSNEWESEESEEYTTTAS